MCPPLFLSTHIKNNVWMDNQPVNIDRAMRQYGRIKHVIESFGLPVLEIPPEPGAQDQTYVANIGVAIEPYVILANYKAPGRDIEVPPARRFFEGLGYQCVQPTTYFEGEADLKKVTDDLYIGGWGQFSDMETYEWISELTGKKIVTVHETSQELYHLDTALFVLDPENFLITRQGLDRKSIKTLEGMANLIMTPDNIASTGITNGVKIPKKQIFLSGTFNPEQPDYRMAMEWLLMTMDNFGYTTILMDTDEADKSGADLSCMVMHLDF